MYMPCWCFFLESLQRWRDHHELNSWADCSENDLGRVGVTSSCYLVFLLFASEEAKEEENVWWTVRSPWQGTAGDLSGAGWTVWAGVSPVFALEGCSWRHCGQQRKGAIKDSWEGDASANLVQLVAVTSCRAQLMTRVIPSLTLSGALGTHPQNTGLSVSLMWPQVHVSKDPEVFVPRRPPREELGDHLIEGGFVICVFELSLL